jgi:anti-sigma regulatory factor (Ser/Thr protein kinase)
VPGRFTHGNTLAELEALLDSVEQYGETCGAPPALAPRLRLVIEELAGNAMRYGYADGRPGSVAVELDWDGSMLQGILEDDGDPFDPLVEAPPPALGVPVAERQVGGLGLHIVKKLTEGIAYARVAGRNRLSFRLRPRPGTN